MLSGPSIVRRRRSWVIDHAVVDTWATGKGPTAVATIKADKDPWDNDEPIEDPFAAAGVPVPTGLPQAPIPDPGFGSPVQPAAANPGGQHAAPAQPRESAANPADQASSGGDQQTDQQPGPTTQQQYRPGAPGMRNGYPGPPQQPQFGPASGSYPLPPTGGSGTPQARQFPVPPAATVDPRMAAVLDALTQVMGSTDSAQVAEADSIRAKAQGLAADAQRSADTAVAKKLTEATRKLSEAQKRLVDLQSVLSQAETAAAEAQQATKDVVEQLAAVPTIHSRVHEHITQMYSAADNDVAAALRNNRS